MLPRRQRVASDVRGKVLLSVRIAATQDSWEFRVPLDLTVEQGARLVSQLVAQRVPALYEASPDVDLMLLAGQGAGGQLNPNETFAALVGQGVLVDGSPVALV